MTPKQATLAVGIKARTHSEASAEALATFRFGLNAEVGQDNNLLHIGFDCDDAVPKSLVDLLYSKASDSYI